MIISQCSLAHQQRGKKNLPLVEWYSMPITRNWMLFGQTPLNQTGLRSSYPVSNHKITEYNELWIHDTLLHWDYANIALRICKYCTENIQILYWEYANIALRICTYCTENMQILHWEYANIALRICRYCTKNIQILHWKYANIALRICKYCTENVYLCKYYSDRVQVGHALTNCLTRMANTWSY